MDRQDPSDQLIRMRRRLASIASLLDQAEQQLKDLTAETAPSAREPSAEIAPPRPSLRERGASIIDRVLALGGPRLLAIAGGIAVVAGLVFLYVLASQRGLLGPTGRVLIGAAASGLLVAVGVWLENTRKGLVAALVATGVGLAGLYIAIVTASRRYDLIAPEVGIVLAGLVAAFAIVIATRWKSELIAGFGVIGALVAPPTLEAGLSAPGVAFAIILSAAVLVLWLLNDWGRLAVAGTIVSGIYAAALIAGAAFDDDRALGWTPYWQAVAGVAAFWALLAAAWIVRLRLERLDGLNLRLLLGAGALSLIAGQVMFEERSAGIAFVLIAAVNLALVAVPRLLGERDRALEIASALIASAALALATLEVLNGASLVVGLALEAVILAVLAVRERSSALEIAAMAHVAVAAAIAIDQTSPLESLFQYPPVALLNEMGDALASGTTIGAMVSAVAVALAAGIAAAAHSRRSGGAEPVLVAIAVALALVAVATVVVDTALLVDLSRGSFQAGHALVSSIWALVALAVLYLGLRRDLKAVRLAGLALLAVTVGKLVLYDLSQLTALARVSSFIVVGVLLLIGSIGYQRMSSEPE